MEVTIDSLGRILIPKKIREKLGLDPQTRLELKVDEGGIRLDPKGSDVELVETDSGALIIRGGPPVTHEQLEEVRLAEYERRFRTEGDE